MFGYLPNNTAPGSTRKVEWVMPPTFNKIRKCRECLLHNLRSHPADSVCGRWISRISRDFVTFVLSAFTRALVDSPDGAPHLEEGEFDEKTFLVQHVRQKVVRDFLLSAE